MSVNAVSSTSNDTAVSALANYVKQTTANQGGSSSALEEASETASATAQEAAHGDPVAKRLLVRQAQEKQLLNPTPANEPGKGAQVDHQA